MPWPVTNLITTVLLSWGEGGEHRSIPRLWQSLAIVISLVHDPLLKKKKTVASPPHQVWSAFHFEHKVRVIFMQIVASTFE